MPIFRVHGVNLQGESSTVDIQCESEAVARKIAAGVFLGLFAWTLFMIVLSLILGVTASFTP
jgi:uncharacterized protein (DUF2062 family)